MTLQAAQLISAALSPDVKFLAHLSALLESEKTFDSLSNEIADSRMKRSFWDVSFRRELLQLYRWAAERLLLAGRSFSGPRDVPETVICLLPRTAPATHLLRRAVPFAALGIPTLCGFAPSCREDSQRFTRVIARAFGLAETLKPTIRTGQDLVRTADAQSLIVVTGRRATVRRVSSKARCKVIGCAGRCAVVLGVDHPTTAVLRNALQAVTVERSCSRVYASFLCAQLREEATVNSLAVSRSPARCSLQEALGRLHPSVIFTLEAAPSSPSDAPEFLAGYRVIECSHDGSAASSIGFGADPVYGWTGDFTV
jgi:hypothetical protein